ncbi:hypothetical protein M9H77_07786 [Catharanthus roseus]|uniref:Uncharacterized protein n=1 Tax=Catharanthus roseus TaxID=4058 RepID=A0ACC0BW30_CATRO|nr:hypothetical protein M9H77_07786 [Catharanthus roseus]
MIWKSVSTNAQVSSTAWKSERIKKHHRSFYAPNLKEQSIPAKHHTSARLPSNRTPISLVKIGYRLLGHLPGLPWGQPQFQAPPDLPLGNRPTAEHDAMST